MKTRRFFTFLAMVCFAVLLSGESSAIIPYNTCATGDCLFSINENNSYFLCDIQTTTEGQVANDPSYDYPYGLLEFEVRPGGCQTITGSVPTGITTKDIMTADVQICFFKNDQTPLDMTGYTYRRYGPTPDRPIPHWYDFMDDGQTGAVIAGNCITLSFVDGQRGDDDLSVNDVIVDQGFPGRRNAAVPAMTPWGMGIVILLIGLTTFLYLRRQRKAK